MIRLIAERKGRGRLGRHVERDPRSEAYAVAVDHGMVTTRSWTRACAPFDQGDLGSCTGNAMAGLLMTDPFYTADRVITEDDAVSLYGAATHLDHVPGAYPPADTGSTGLAVAKAAHRRGWILGYRHAFTLRASLMALMQGPVILGMHWYEGFDEPQGDDARLIIAGGIRGGHEVEILGLDADAGIVRGINSWGPDWGDRGYFTMDLATLERLLAEEGDVVAPYA